MRMKGKAVIVTGAAANIGRSVALAFAREGARIVVNSRSNEKGCAAVVDEIRALGGEALYVVGDVSDEQVSQNLVSKCLDSFGSLDILVNNAGSAIKGSFELLPKSHWEETLESNLLSAVVCSRAVAPVMLKSKCGCILNTTSVRGLEHCGRTGVMAYSAAKAALSNFTKQLAVELAPHVTVNGVAPGYTLTSAFDAMSEQDKAAIAAKSLIKRWISSDELAQAYVFLSTMPAITGEILVVDGGYNLKELSSS